jgi:hypothetical protein
MIPLCIRNKSNNAISSTARVPISESKSPKLHQNLKQIKSENINISLKQKKANITTIKVILITVSAYMTSKEVEMKTASVIMKAATESIQPKQSILSTPTITTALPPI